jgi:hypothetical protein
MGKGDEGKGPSQPERRPSNSLKIKSPFDQPLPPVRDAGAPPEAPDFIRSPTPTSPPLVIHGGTVQHFLAALGLGVAAIAAFQGAQALSPPPSTSQTMEGDAAQAVRAIAQMAFEHLLEKSIDEAYEALAAVYFELRLRKKTMAAEERREADRLPEPDGPDGRDIFQSVWKLLRPILCDEKIKKALPKDGKQFGESAIKYLQDAGVLSKEITCLAPIVGAALAVAVKKTLAECCEGNR